MKLLRDGHRRPLIALVLGVTAAAVVGPAGAGIPPANDYFENATPISSLPFTDSTLSDLATPELGEPVCGGGKSIWYRFDPVVDTNIVIDTAGTTVRYFYLGAYEGTSLDSLSPIECQRGDYSLPAVGFFARAGRSYRIVFGSTGLIDYGARIQVNADLGSEIKGRLTTLGSATPIGRACVSVREAHPSYRLTYTYTSADGTYSLPGLRAFSYRGPTFGCHPLYHSKYDADQIALGRAEIRVIDQTLKRKGSASGVIRGSDGEPLSGVCTTAYDATSGEWVGSTYTGSGSAADGTYTAPVDGTRYAHIRFAQCASPFTYRPVWWPSAPDRSGATPIAVTDEQDSPGFDVTMPLATVPANDDQLDATPVTALPYADSTNTYLATRQDNEPLAPVSCADGPTVWYRYTASSDMTITASGAGSDFRPGIAIFRASRTLDGGAPLRPLADTCHPGTYSGATVADLALQAGETYLFQVSGSGELRLNIGREAVPLNDDRADAVDVMAIPLDQTVRTFAATAEVGEDVRCGLMARTVWYHLKPPTNRKVSVGVIGGDDRRAAIAVYRAAPAPLDQPVQIGCTSTYDYLGASGLTFDATAGRDYWIQIGGVTGTGGVFSVRMTDLPAPVNDDRAAATSVSTLPFIDDVDLGSASVEDGETVMCGPSVKTVWYRFTPDADAFVSISTAGSQGVETTLAIYRETAHGPPVLASCDNDSDQDRKRLARAAMSVSAGESYLLQIGSLDTRSGTLHLEMRPEVRPPNDDLASAAPIIDTAEARTYAAGTEPGEIMPCGANATGPAFATVWYAFQAPATGRYAVSTAGSDYDTTAGVYVSLGAPVAGPLGLRQLACNDDDIGTRQSWVPFNATAGTTYFIQIGGWRLDAGIARVSIAPSS